MALGGATIRPNPTGLLILIVVFLIFIFYVHSGNKWWRTDPQVSLKELLSVSIDLAVVGGARVRKIQEGALKQLNEESKGGGKDEDNALHAKSKGLTKEGAKELITEGDINSHRSIVYGFNKAFPGLHLISEEHDIKPPDFNAIPMPIKNLALVNEISDEKVAMSAVTVWIDPLDATQEYSYMRKDQNQFVTVMICVAVHGRPVIGVVHQPFVQPPPTKNSTTTTTTPADGGQEGTSSKASEAAAASMTSTGETHGRTFWAWVGKSANFAVPSSTEASALEGTVDGRRLTVSPSGAGGCVTCGAPSPRVIISQSHAGDARAVLDAALGNVTLVRAGGAGFKVISVIEKKVDLYYHQTRIKKWDICAGDALMSSVGGRMTTLSGDVVDYSYDLGKTAHLVDGKLVVALKEKHDEYRKKLISAVAAVDKAKKTKGA